MLTYALSRLAPNAWHRIMGWMRVSPADFHDWLEGFCPCDAGHE